MDINLLKPKTPLFKTTKNVSLKLFKSSMRYFLKLHLKICVLNYFFIINQLTLLIEFIKSSFK